MSQKLSQNVTYWLGVIAIGLVVGLSLQFVRAWTEPAVAPPGGNVGAPINTSGAGQTKVGGLQLNCGTGLNCAFNGTSAANGLLVPNGNVGIGTAGPISISGVNTGLLNLRSSDNPGIIFIDGGEVANQRVSWITGNQQSLQFGKANDDGTSPSTFMVINNNSNVGIGTTAPEQKLDVVGTAQLRGAVGETGLFVNSNGYVGIGTTAPGTKLQINGTDPTLSLNYPTSGSDWRFTSDDSPLGLRLWVSGGAFPGEKVFFGSNGNVGIGTAGPGAKLDVVGNVRATDVCTTGGKCLSAAGGGTLSCILATCSTAYSCTATCPAGYTVTGCGYKYIASRPGTDGMFFFSGNGCEGGPYDNDTGTIIQAQCCKIQ